MNNGNLLMLCLGLAAFLMNYKRIVRWACNTDAHNNNTEGKQ
ncbi:Uncharacterised protein [Burkholderia pseudomallei]|nr:hypothetical protein [Burkholderia pseudomallei]CAJ3483968.1 Uncharacterised protein [Burkholderia pseudomallei]CAJ4173232.1 Uncharacterised protein [Burkholderia pseudomallei]CAJ4615400.1 Uncharacterised protein [Burkholderia pseudomallei]CAJ5597873.1 Uncharacterised protein [Burkholderia pseudomallei]CAJ6081685.1 Uncharacterised protein [Burkholderia pseudomallei]